MDESIMCRHCGDPIPEELLIPPYHRRRYCSDECRRGAAKRRWEEHWTEPCPRCGARKDRRTTRCRSCYDGDRPGSARRREAVRLYNETDLTTYEIADRVGIAQSGVVAAVALARQRGHHVRARSRGPRARP